MAWRKIAKDDISMALSRRRLLQAGAGLAGGALLPAGMMLPALADDHPALGTYPAGSAGASVFVGISVPRTGTYAAAGEDLIKGYQLAIEHLNAGSELMQKISPNIKKGVLGKEVKFGIADSEAKPNTAVQNFSKFVSQNQAIMVTGSVSSAEAVADNKTADREKVIYLPGISGSNDTTGKDCVRYSFRECFYAQTAAKAIAPVLIKNIGKDKKVAYLTPDYTYGHTVQKSMEEFVKEGGWTTATDQVSPLGTTEFSSLSAERRQQRRRRGGEHQFRPRRHPLHPAGQAVRHPGQDDPGGALQHALPRQGSRRRHHAGRLRRHRLLVDAGG